MEENNGGIDIGKSSVGCIFVDVAKMHYRKKIKQQQKKTVTLCSVRRKSEQLENGLKYNSCWKQHF